MARRGAWLEGLLALVGIGCLAWASWEGIGPPPAFDPERRVEGALRVVTWNVGGGLEDGPHALRDEHVAHVASALSALDPDLVLLQEVEGGRQLARLRRSLGPGWRDASSRGVRGRRVVALARRGTLDSFPLPREAGAALGVVFRPSEGAPLVAVGVHSDAYSSERRNLELGGALEALLGQAPPGARLLAGDLNLDLDLDKRRDLFTDDLYRDVETYNFVAGHLADAARGRGTTAEPDRRLDYVFVSPELEVAAAGPWKDQRAGDMDHDPVVVDLLPAR